MGASSDSTSARLHARDWEPPSRTPPPEPDSLLSPAILSAACVPTHCLPAACAAAACAAAVFAGVLLLSEARLAFGASTPPLDDAAGEDDTLRGEAAGEPEPVGRTGDERLIQTRRSCRREREARRAGAEGTVARANAGAGGQTSTRWLHSGLGCGARGEKGDSAALRC